VGVAPPSLPDLRILAAARGVADVEEADLEAARTILIAFLGSLAELEAVVPPDTVPMADLPTEP
jgi:hypothetical protein